MGDAAHGAGKNDRRHSRCAKNREKAPTLPVWPSPSGRLGVTTEASRWFREGLSGRSGPSSRMGRLSSQTPAKARERPLCGREPERGGGWVAGGVAVARKGRRAPPAAVEGRRARTRAGGGRPAAAAPPNVGGACWSAVRRRRRSWSSILSGATSLCARDTPATPPKSAVSSFVRWVDDSVFRSSLDVR